MEPTTYTLTTTESLSFEAAVVDETAVVAASPGRTHATLRLHATAACFVFISPSTDASASNGFPLAADATEYVDVPIGSAISVIGNAATGTLYVTSTAKPTV